MADAAIPFCDLRAAHAARAADIEAALLRVARSGRYVLGPEVEAFETEFAAQAGAARAVGVGSGTAALTLILMAAGIGAGDDVVVPAYTAAATWMAVALTGARPVGADVDPQSGLLDPSRAADAVGPRTRAVIAVHLFGRLAAVEDLREIADPRELLVIEDAAHAAGVREGTRSAGTLGDAAAFSFYPTKTLGGLGDGGAVVSNDSALADEVRRLRSYGWTSWQGEAARPGTNSRLDELQAAVLRVGLERLPGEHALLRVRAAELRQRLAGIGELTLPARIDGAEPPWHQFVVRHRRRPALRDELAARGIGTAVHYDPLPPDLEAFSPTKGEFPVADRLAAEAVSLPFDPWLSEAQVARVADGVLAAVAAVDGRSI